MRSLIVTFVTAVCFLFLLKLKWPKNKNSSFQLPKLEINCDDHSSLSDSPKQTTHGLKTLTNIACFPDVNGEEAGIVKEKNARKNGM